MRRPPNRSLSPDASAALPDPPPREVNRLIQRARKHELGLAYLRNGALDSVAAMFQVHAFVVEGARERLK